MDIETKLKEIIPSEFENLKDLVPVDKLKEDRLKYLFLALKRSAIFDETKYYEEYPDVKKNNIDAVKHYVYDGIKEERQFFRKRSENNKKCINNINCNIKRTTYTDLKRENTILLEQLCALQKEIEYIYAKHPEVIK